MWQDYPAVAAGVPQTQVRLRQVHGMAQMVEAYLAAYAAAARTLARRRFLLEEDVPAVLARGAEEWDLAAGAP